jgi:hypothetical protein
MDGSDIDWAFFDRYAAGRQSTITLPSYIKTRPRIYPATDFLCIG